MKKSVLSLAVILAATAAVAVATPALTIYNQNFAVVRDSVSLDLKQGENQVRVTDTTAHLEPDSVILRDPQGKTNLQILEQNYRNDPVSQELLLSMFEGKTIDFLVTPPNQPSTTVQGKIIRSGYVSHGQEAMQRYGQSYAMSQYAMSYGNGGSSQPIIEVDGKLRFSMPGQPLFPPLDNDSILKPTLEWQLHADKGAKLTAELAYITGGMSWEADYNIVAPEGSDDLDLVGWVTIDNQSGKTFDEAKIKLMAGDVSKIQEGQSARMEMAAMKVADAASATAVTEKAFEDYHLYSLPRTVTLRDRETKQVEFIHATGVHSTRLYLYDGMQVDWSRYGGSGMENIRNNENLGADSDTKVAIVREFKNSAANQLGIPLPKGRMRFYKQDTDKQLEFTGENLIDHTPKDETLRVYTGNAFDLVGQRVRTNFHRAGTTIDETYEITLRNHKEQPVEIRVDEHLFRWTNWEITTKSDPFTKTNAQEIEFRVQLKPDEEKKVTYTVHYSW